MTFIATVLIMLAGLAGPAHAARAPDPQCPATYSVDQVVAKIDELAGQDICVTGFAEQMVPDEYYLFTETVDRSGQTRCFGPEPGWLYMKYARESLGRRYKTYFRGRKYDPILPNIVVRGRPYKATQPIPPENANEIDTYPPGAKVKTGGGVNRFGGIRVTRVIAFGTSSCMRG